MDHHESSLSSSPLSLRKKRREFSKCKSFSAAPFILYRSTKYSSLRSRIFDYVTSARTYLSGRYPKLRSLLGTTLLYHVAVGILLPLVCLPILLVSFCGKYDKFRWKMRWEFDYVLFSAVIQLYRKVRISLVKKYYPEVRICDDFNARWVKKILMNISI